MTNRDNILRALRRLPPERVGFDFVFSPALLDEFHRRTGRTDYQEYYHFPLRCIELDATRLQTDYTVFFDELPAGTRPLDWKAATSAVIMIGRSRNRAASRVASSIPMPLSRSSLA